jgi:hypothetical protein
VQPVVEAEHYLRHVVNYMHGWHFVAARHQQALELVFVETAGGGARPLEQVVYIWRLRNCWRMPGGTMRLLLRSGERNALRRQQYDQMHEQMVSQ